MRLSLAALAFMAAFATVETAPTFAQVPTEAARPPATFAADARAIVQKYVDQNQFSGTVLVARAGQPVFREGFGLANREFDIPNKPETIFRLGSITKQFTAAAILQLQEQGKLSVNDPISKYYTASPAAWSKVTIKHLLTHRSGIPSYTGQPGYMLQKVKADITPEGLIEVTRDMPLEFEPGTKYAYDNSGYVLLGYVVEKVSGEKYADYVQKHIFTPLGMKNSGYDVSETILPNRASGYNVQGAKWTNAPYLSMTQPYAAGSLYSTGDDLLIWDQALLTEKLLKKASLEAMNTNHGDAYGYGVGFSKVGSHDAISHGGGIHGFATMLQRYTKDGVTVIALSNLQSGQSGRISTDLSRLYFNVPAPPPPSPLKAVAVKPEVLERYVGVYEIEPGFDVTIRRDGDKLTAQATGQGMFTFTPTSDTEFHFQQAGIKTVFPAGTGPAPSFILTQGGRDRTAKRKP